MSSAGFTEHVTALAEELGVVGVAAGVMHGDTREQAYVGTTSLSNPLPVDAGTLFQFGSTGKTMTATALMLLEQQGVLDLSAPVRRYVPELQLADEHVTETVTVLQLLNHAAGWDGEQLQDTGDGDDAVAAFVAGMRQLPQLTSPGAVVSYNNAAVILAGRVLEKVTGSTFESAVRDLVLHPLGLMDTYYRPADVMTRRFAVGHQPGPDGVAVIPLWALPRSANPAGGACSTLDDQLRWAEVHLGRTGADVLPAETRRRMQEPTAFCRGSAMGEAIGIAWQLDDIGGARIVSHGGATYGQHSAFLLAPDHDFAVVALTNTGPAGVELCKRLVADLLEQHLGVVRPEAHLAPAADAAPYCGRYGFGGVLVQIAAENEVLRLTVEPPALPPMELRLLDGDGDRFLVCGGPLDDTRGYFHRGADGEVDGLHLAGRFAPRAER